MNISRRLFYSILLTLFFVGPSTTRAQFDLDIRITNPASFTTTQLASLEAGLDTAEALWESKITGYQPGIAIPSLRVDVVSGSSFANANVTGSVLQEGFRLNTRGTVRINPGVIDLFTSWDGMGPTIPNTEFVGVNYVDDILAHEIGHLIGINSGTWNSNGVAQFGSGRYTGAFGLAAYQQEFDATATFVPVELAGGSGTPHNHWDQIIRSNPNLNIPEGVRDTGANPFDLDPRTGITDHQGRDLAFELMTGTVDPDYGEPFLSNTTIQSFRDLGYTVVPEPSSLSLLLAALLLNFRRSQDREPRA